MRVKCYKMDWTGKEELCLEDDVFGSLRSSSNLTNRAVLPPTITLKLSSFSDDFIISNQ